MIFSAHSIKIIFFGIIFIQLIFSTVHSIVFFFGGVFFVAIIIMILNTLAVETFKTFMLVSSFITTGVLGLLSVLTVNSFPNWCQLSGLFDKPESLIFFSFYVVYVVSELLLWQCYLQVVSGVGFSSDDLSFRELSLAVSRGTVGFKWRWFFSVLNFIGAPGLFLFITKLWVFISVLSHLEWANSWTVSFYFGFVIVLFGGGFAYIGFLILCLIPSLSIFMVKKQSSSVQLERVRFIMVSVYFIVCHVGFNWFSVCLLVFLLVIWWVQWLCIIICCFFIISVLWFFLMYKLK